MKIKKKLYREQKKRFFKVNQFFFSFQLTDINLSHNKINGIHKNFFEGIKGTVQTINLGHNLLEDVPASGCF